MAEDNVSSEDFSQESGTIIGNLIEKNGCTYISTEDGSLIQLDSEYFVLQQEDVTQNLSQIDNFTEGSAANTDDSLQPSKRPRQATASENSGKTFTGNAAASVNPPEPFEMFVLSKEAVRSVACPGGSKVTVFSCELCRTDGKTVQYSLFSTLSKHYAKVHRKHLLRKQPITCREEACTFRTWKLENLRMHLEVKHGLSFERRKLSFRSMEEFHAWKEEEERRTCNQFAQSSGGHKLRNENKNQHYYYACRRTGKYETRAVERRKSNKNKGSAKINGHCTSTMTAILNRQKGVVQCEYCPTHYGHGDSSPHIYLTKQEKSFIYQLVLRGWTTTEIIESLSTGKIEGVSDRMRRVDSKDVANICRRWDAIKSLERKDDEDETSMELWSRQLQAEGTAIIYKAPEVIDKNRKIPTEAFLLVLMNESQAGFAKSLANGGCLYYIRYPISIKRRKEAQLLAFLCAEQTGDQAYLAAAALTDASESQVISTVISAMQNRVDGFSPSFLFSDDPALISTAWRSATSKSVRCVLPPWQIDEDWKDAAEKLIQNEAKRGIIQHCLSRLLVEDDPVKSESIVSLIQTMGSVDPDCTSFSNYFQNNYAWRLSSVSGSSQPSCDSSYKSFVACSKELANIASRARQVKRLDKAIYSLVYLGENQPLSPVTHYNSAPKQDGNQHPDEETTQEQVDDIPDQNSSNIPKEDELAKEAPCPEAGGLSAETPDKSENQLEFTCGECGIAVRCMHTHKLDCIPPSLARKVLCKHFHLVVTSGKDPAKKEVSHLHVTQPYSEEAQLVRSNLLQQIGRLRSILVKQKDVATMEKATALLEQAFDLCNK